MRKAFSGFALQLGCTKIAYIRTGAYLKVRYQVTTAIYLEIIMSMKTR